jgi:hypothetical protein
MGIGTPADHCTACVGLTVRRRLVEPGLNQVPGVLGRLADLRHEAVENGQRGQVLQHDPRARPVALVLRGLLGSRRIGLGQREVDNDL